MSDLTSLTPGVWTVDPDPTEPPDTRFTEPAFGGQLGGRIEF